MAGVRLRLFEGIVAMLRAAALQEGTGAVLVVDDAQWAEASTSELLDFVARRTRRLPRLLPMTYQGDEDSSERPLRTMLEGRRRAGPVSTIEMRRLSASQPHRTALNPTRQR